MKKIVLLVLLVGLLQANEVYKVVYDLTTDNMKTFEQKVLGGIPFTKDHYQGDSKELEAVVIIHGGAYKFFLNDVSKSTFKNEQDVINAQPNLKTRLKKLADTYNITFLMCNVGATKHKLKRENIYSFVKMTPSAVIGLINMQNKGYAYIPID
ncbi:MAG: DsrE family protein [Helicobacteraceae bacterium]|jgi:intracellular sulfur oxidation DsrE/DsrF family protein|nr:DsrE family protein [Helicobacteraceae bacterium]